MTDQKTENELIDGKAAVKVALDYVVELFGQDGIKYLGVEEVVPSDDGFNVTVGFTRPWNESTGLASLHTPFTRDYKVVEVGGNGRVKAVRIRRVQ